MFGPQVRFFGSFLEKDLGTPPVPSKIDKTPTPLGPFKNATKNGRKGDSVNTNVSFLPVGGVQVHPKGTMSHF